MILTLWCSWIDIFLWKCTPISDFFFDKVNKTEKSKSSNKIVDTPRSNKTDKVKSIDKSRCTQITDTENTVNKSRSIPRTNLSNKSTRIEKPSEIDIHRDNLSVSVLSGHGEILSSVTPDQQNIPRKNKKVKLQTLRLLEKSLFKNQSTQGKGKINYFNRCRKR